MNLADNAVTAYIAVGSNIDPESNIAAALDLLGQKVLITGVSSFYRTKPLHRADQPDYLNGVVAIHTQTEPHRLKYEVLRPIESQLGRVRSRNEYAARPIDLDLVMYGDRVVHSSELHLPDEDIFRPFVGLAILELNPGLVLPDRKKPLADFFDSGQRATLQNVTEFSRLLKGTFCR